MKTYRVRVSTDRVTWTCVDNCKIFIGNLDKNTEVDAIFKNSVVAQFVRIFPETWHSHMSMRSAVLAIKEETKEEISGGFGIK